MAAAYEAVCVSRGREAEAEMMTTALVKKARDVMGSPVVSVRTTDSLEKAARVMIEKNIGCLPVVDEKGRFAGMVTERSFQSGLAGVRPGSARPFHERVLQELFISGGSDFSAVQRGFEKARTGAVSEAMVTDAPTTNDETELWRVAELMLRSHLSHIAVLRDGRPVGVVARHDLLRAYAGK